MSLLEQRLTDENAKYRKAVDDMAKLNNKFIEENRQKCEATTKCLEYEKEIKQLKECLHKIKNVMTDFAIEQL